MTQINAEPPICNAAKGRIDANPPICDAAIERIDANPPICGPTFRRHRYIIATEWAGIQPMDSTSGTGRTGSTNSTKSTPAQSFPNCEFFYECGRNRYTNQSMKNSWGHIGSIFKAACASRAERALLGNELLGLLLI